MQTDMTVGKPMKMILDFTIPVFIGNVFQQFYNMADAIIVGKFVGTKGLAAVGSTGTIMFLIIGFLTGLTAGFTVLTSQKFGAGKMDEMRQSVGNAALLSIIISVIMTAVSMVGMHSLLTLMHTPEDIFRDAYTYIMIICGGIFAQVLYNILASILRALGNSKTPLYFLILAAPDVYYCFPYGSRRGCLGNDHSTGSIRSALPDLYHKIRTGIETEGG
jgi:Na+-driven multidrug efflux pump